MKPTNINDPEYFHKVVDCQYACPAHTPVPEYIRLIAAKRYTEAYMINWESNVFPGILGRTCDRPCEPACRRGRLGQGEKPVAICRLKRVAADNKGSRETIKSLMPKPASQSNGKRIALIGAGPASLTVARDLAPLGYTIDLYDEAAKGGGMMRSQIPGFRLPASVLDEEVDYILELGIQQIFNVYIDSLQAILAKNYDAVFIGTGAPRGRALDLPGLEQAKAHVHIGIDWLSSVAFEHVKKIGKRVLVIGGGNTAMDCCRTARRLGGEDVKIVVRSGFEEMKASPWEKEDATAEDIPFFNFHVPKQFVLENGALMGMEFEKVDAVYENGRRKLVPTGEAPVFFACDDVLMAIGQDNAYPWIERDIGLEFGGKWDMPVVDKTTFATTLDTVFIGGDAAFGPENVITAVAHGHQAAISIDLRCFGKNVHARPSPYVNLVSQKMGIHQWGYDSDISPDKRFIVPHVPKQKALSSAKVEVELGFDQIAGFEEAQRCLNCDAQTVFEAPKCIECDACMDVCPTDCISFVANASEDELRQNLQLPAKNTEQSLYISDTLKATQRIMVKDEDVCLHCGLCAERCPTAAWDMSKFRYDVAVAGKTA